MQQVSTSTQVSNGTLAANEQSSPQQIASRAKTEAPQEKIHALTSLRFFAALYVVLNHNLWYAIPGMSRESIPGRILSLGFLSVGFFYLLSGYILSIVYLRNRKPLERRAFYTARFARVYPLFLLTLILGTPFLLVARVAHYGVAVGAGRTAITFLAHIFMLQAWFPQLRGIDNPNWSLSVETVFYLLFPFIGVLVWRLKGSWIWITGAAIWIVSQALVQLAFPHLPDDVMELNPLLHVGTFTLGIVLARWQTQRRIEYGASPANPVTAGAAIVFALAAFGAVVALTPHQTPVGKLGDGLLAPIYAAILWAFSNSRSLPARLLSAPWLVVLGEASFGLYLIHYPAYQLFAALGLVPIHALYPLYLLGCIALSVASFYLVETPARKWLLKRLHTRPKETMEAASDAQ